MVFDPLVAVGLTVGSAIIVAALASHYPSRPASRSGAAVLLIAPALASALLVVALALAIFKPGWRLRSSGTAGADTSPRHASSPDSWPIVRLVARCT